MEKRASGRRRVHAASVLLALALGLLVMAAFPRVALARDYEITSVDIDATVGDDGSLEVKEVREFDFDGSFHGVYWNIPTGSYEGNEIETTILSVGEIIDGEFVPFDNPGYDSGADRSYVITEYYSYVEVKLYAAHEDESAQFGIVYRDTNLAVRYDDTAELYWKFVSDGWDVESQDVSCTIHLPVPDGESVRGGENVRAWGHGPLDATVGFSDNDVVYQVPGVGTSEFAEARIAFPAEWLTQVESKGSGKLDSILEEEQRWADEANAKRARARVLVAAVSAIGLATPLVSLVVAIVKYRAYKRQNKPQFDDTYFRDVPSSDHPAVLGALYEGGEPSDECLTASLMRLTDMNYMKLELVKYTTSGFLGREKVKEDYCVTPTGWPARGSNYDGAQHIDEATMKFLFDQLAPKASEASKAQGGLLFGDIEDIARKHPEKYDEWRSSWLGSVKGECERRGFFEGKKGMGKGLVIGLSALDFIISAAAFALAIVIGALWWLNVAILLFGIASGIACAILATNMKARSEEATELVAKLEALRRWLKDFTRLDEAVPQDVVLWNRLFVMAVVLGVADEVIDQLKMAAPQVLDDPLLAPTYGWYYLHGPSLPARSFGSAVASAHSVSAAKLASSSSSGGGGGGGGFSGGGGGGFGGGGGGGAF